MAKQNSKGRAFFGQRTHSFINTLTLFFAFFAIIFLCFLVGLNFVKPAHAAGVTFVQASAAAPGTKATSEKITFSKAVQQGDFLIGWFAQKSASGQVSVSDNVNGAWTRGPSEKFSNGTGDIALYYKANSKASTTGITITVSAGSSTYFKYTAADYSGTATSSVIDKVNIAEAKGTSVKAITGTSAPAEELIFGAEVTGGSPTAFTVGSSQGIQFVKRASNSNGSAGAEDILSGASGIQNSSFTLSSSTDWYSVVATIKPAPLPTPTPTPLPTATPTPTPIPTYSISGTVYTDSNQNGSQDAGEQPYQGATVSLSGDATATATSDTNGNYTFSNLPVGSYSATLTLPTGYSATSANPIPVTLLANTTANFGITPIVYTINQWNSGLSNVIHSDVTQSVTLPNGNILWDFGDTTQVNGIATCCAYGYPHDAFVTQAPNTQNFTPVPGNYGYGWQQVPNWSDGTFFWMGTPIIDNGTLYVLGGRIQATSSSFTIIGNYVAAFDPQTLAFANIVPIPNGATGQTGWSGAVPGTNGGVNGWWIMGTHPVPCSYVTDCKAGDLAFVPSGQLANSAAWIVTDNFLPASFNEDTTMALLQTATGWDIFTKQGGPYGGTQIERLSASSLNGPWSVTGTWAAPSPTGTYTYNVAVHPEQASPPGQILVSYNVGGDSANYHALFLYLPK